MEEELKHILLENFETVSGSKIKKIQISYQVFGKELGSAPVILVNHALTGNSLVSGINGWWSEIIGLEKPIDTSKYSVLCFNIPGNGFNENNFDFNLDLNLGDIALLFVKAIEQLKLAKLHAIIGGSIGGCLTWEMIALKNDLASIIIPVAADWKATDWLIANTFLQERILKNSRDPVSDARIHAMTFYRSPKSLNTR
ncbi:alpha/beta fold hydrolase, partial [Flavobacteriaceae bacterium]|nr:alpha/beta fold hydrolase [Flavobacteriaceae bacterium]